MLLLGVLALVAVVVAACEASGWPFLREPLSRALAKGLQREVRIGERFQLRLIGSVRLRSDSLVVGSPAGTPVVHDRAGRAQPFIDGRGIDLSLPYSTVLALLRSDRDQPLRVRSLDVAEIELGLARNTDGIANWHIGPADAARDEDRSLPEFGRLVVRSGRLRLDDARARLLLDATIRTREGDAQAGAAGLEASAVGRWHDAALEATLHAAGLLPLAAPADDNGAAVPLQLKLKVGATRLELDGRAGDLLQLSALDAKVRLAGPSLAAVGDMLGIALPSSKAFAMSGQLRKAGPVWSGDVAALSIGSSRLAGEFRYDPQPAVPALSGRLTGARLALADLGPAFGARGDPRAPDPAPNRVLPHSELDLPSLRAMNAELAVRLDEVDLGTPSIDTLRPLDGRLLLRDRLLSIDDLLARTSGGELRGALSLDARQQTPRWSADVRWSGVRLERFVKPRRTGGVAPVSGFLNGRAKLQGSGQSTAVLFGSLDGTSELWIHDGRISQLLVEMIGTDIAGSLGLLAGGDQQLPVRCAVARLVLRNGVITPEVAVLDTPDTTITLTGTISLDDEQLALTLTPWPKNFSLFSLRAPLRIEGPFANPQVQRHAGRIGARVAAAAALATVAGPLAGLLAFGDLGEAERTACAEALQGLHRAVPTGKKR